MPVALKVFLTLGLTNGLLLAAALTVGGKLAPAALDGFYGATAMWQRGLLVMLAYALAIVLQVRVFKQEPALAGFMQTVIAVGFISFMALVLGNKMMTAQLAVATLLLLGAAGVFAWALEAAPYV